MLDDCKLGTQEIAFYSVTAIAACYLQMCSFYSFPADDVGTNIISCPQFEFNFEEAKLSFDDHDLIACQVFEFHFTHQAEMAIINLIPQCFLLENFIMFEQEPLFLYGIKVEIHFVRFYR